MNIDFREVLNSDIRKDESFEKMKKRFLDKVNKTDTCWLWTSTKAGSYGNFSFFGRKYKASRVSYMLFKGPILAELVVRHTCDNKLCVNPDHLILGTQVDNCEDAVKRNKQGSQKLNSEAVKVIKWMLKYRPEKGLAAKLARLHKVHPTTIANIKKRRSWHWIEV